MTFYAGDIPAHDLVFDPALDLSTYTGADAILVAPDGSDLTLEADIDGDSIVVEWPAGESPFPTGGLYTLKVSVTGAGSTSERLPPVTLIAQDDSDGWLTLDTIREQWPDAESIGDRSLYSILQTAKFDVIAYAPPLELDQMPPENYSRAQLMHARDIWNSSTVDSSGQFGEGTFAVRPFPLDWMVKQILRPKRGLPVVA
jgi:hypothetical protein